MKYLIDYLTELAQSDEYPFHMPGHKRTGIPFPNPYEIDITEIDGFDNLHHAEGILKEAQKRAAALYQSDRCFYLVNGSTCGLLAAIAAVTGRGDKVIVARNCHKAVYHALFLNGLRAEYLYPVITESGIQGQITEEQVKNALNQSPDTAAVIITSPTYEGIVSDVKGIAKACHACGVPLIVDEAHGAHFGFGGGFPENAVKLGADITIMSLHKTLPSFTQTALLHVNRGLVSEKKVEKYLGIYETSSPSYVFMAGIDECIRLVDTNGQELFEGYRKRLDSFYEKAKSLKKIHVMNRSDVTGAEAFDCDDSKIVIFSEKAGLTGEELHRILLHKYRLQMEMVSGYYVLGMTSLMDKEEGLDRLFAALREIETQCVEIVDFQTGIVDNIQEKQKSGGKTKEFIEKMYQKNPCQMQIAKAEALPQREVSFEEAIGKVSADMIFLYPPGIPLIVPGEVITEQFVLNLRECKKIGLRVEGAADLAQNTLKIVYF